MPLKGAPQAVPYSWSQANSQAEGEVVVGEPHFISCVERQRSAIVRTHEIKANRKRFIDVILMTSTQKES
jgi:hypothetical protein